MTIKELINELKTLPPDGKVFADNGTVTEVTNVFKCVAEMKERVTKEGYRCTEKDVVLRWLYLD